MKHVTNIGVMLSGLPPEVLDVVQILAAFALAAFAIYAMLVVVRKEK